MLTRPLILFLVLSATALLIRAVGYDEYAPDTQGVSIIEKIPGRLGSWQGSDIALSERVYELLQTRAIIHRTYRHPQLAEDIFLSLVYYNRTRVDFHAPESCLGGLGLKTERKAEQVVLKKGDETIAVDLYQLVQTHEGRKTLVFYFYKTGRFVGRSYLKLRLNLVFNKIAGNRQSGALIRLSTPITEPDGMDASKTRLRGFIERLYPFLIDHL